MWWVTCSEDSTKKPCETRLTDLKIIEQRFLKQQDRATSTTGEGFLFFTITSNVKFKSEHQIDRLLSREATQKSNTFDFFPCWSKTCLQKLVIIEFLRF